jgi:hypothetical protein
LLLKGLEMENKGSGGAVVFSTKLGPGKGKQTRGWIGRALDKEQSFGIHDTASRLIYINWVWGATAALFSRCLSLLEGVAGFVDDH